MPVTVITWKIILLINSIPTSETVNPIHAVGRTPWMEHLHIAWPRPMEDKETRMYIHAASGFRKIDSLRVLALLLLRHIPVFECCIQISLSFISFTEVDDSLRHEDPQLTFSCALQSS
jgi:hypothetical protein